MIDTLGFLSDVFVHEPKHNLRLRDLEILHPLNVNFIVKDLSLHIEAGFKNELLHKSAHLTISYHIRLCIVIKRNLG